VISFVFSLWITSEFEKCTEELITYFGCTTHGLGTYLVPCLFSQNYGSLKILTGSWGFKTACTKNVALLTCIWWLQTSHIADPAISNLLVSTSPLFQRGTPCYGLYGDVPQERVQFLASLSWTGYIIFLCDSVVNRVWTCPKQGVVAWLSSLTLTYAVFSNPRSETFVRYLHASLLWYFTGVSDKLFGRGPSEEKFSDAFSAHFSVISADFFK